MNGGDVEMSNGSWGTVGLIAAIAGAVIALHGITSRRWQTFHTIAVIAGMAAYVGPRTRLGR
jgi:hypothetical protein